MYYFKKTFTLIEMLIVIVIIGILAAALVPRLQAVQGRARDTQRKADFQQLNNALFVYFTDNSKYPFPQNSQWSCHGWVQYCVSPSHKQTAQTGWIKDLQPTYMTTLPVDPINTNIGTDARIGPWTYTNSYVYGYVTNGGARTSFTLMANLENDNDPDTCENRGGTLNDARTTQSSPCVPLSFVTSYVSGEVVKKCMS